MATFGSIESPAPNVLFNPMAVDQALQTRQKNALMIDNAREDQAFQRQTQQVTMATAERDYLAREAQALLEVPDEQLPAAYAERLQRAQALGFGRNALPPEQITKQHLKAFVAAGMTPAQLQELQEKREGREMFSRYLGGGAPAVAAPAAPGAAPGGPLNPQTFALQRGQESSGGNPNASNPLSSATGPDQFIDGTWLQYAAANPDRFRGLNREQILARRTDPAESAQATQWLAGENAKQLQAAGMPAGQSELALAHRFGAMGAARVMRADPNAPIDAVVGPGVMEANPDLAGKTAGQVLGQYRQRYAGGGAAPQPTPAGGVATRTGGTDVAGPGVPAADPSELTQQQRVEAAMIGQRDPKAAIAYIAQARQQNVANARADAAAARAEAAANRQATAAERQAAAVQQQLATSDWIPDPNNPGAVTFRPGGPQDPAVIARNAQARGENKAGKLSPAEIEIKQETEDRLAGLQSAAAALKAAKDLSPNAYAGYGAETRGALAGQTGYDSATAKATREFSSIMTEQVVGQLKTIFGGNPTEGERKILMDMSASASMSRTEREALIDRAQKAVATRMEAAQRRLQEVKSGNYGRVADGQEPAAPAGGGGKPRLKFNPATGELE